MVIQSSFLVILVPVVHVAGYINIYHKTKVLLVILRCLKYLNIIWNKSEDLNHKCLWQLSFSILEEKNLKI